MTTRTKKTKQGRTPFKGTQLIREVSYLHLDESEALAERAKQERCSKAEVIRRALRAYLDFNKDVE